jgi:tRNA A-37 threonylcarbamoyl transferase component Bud32/ribosomal protein S27E
LSFEASAKELEAGDIRVESSERQNRDTDSQPIEIDETAMFGSGHDTSAMSSEGYSPNLGDAFGRYRILKTLGKGAMGSVYLAHDTQLDRKVALKIPKFSAEQDSKFIARFLREARSAATLSHPNICSIFDVGEIGRTHFITMAYIQGHPLSEFINPDKPQRDRNVASTVRKIALALQEAHGNGVVHRDVKPANIMIDQRTEPIIMDFGLARPINDADDARLTRDGAILGSPAYMSPEQIEGRPDKLGPACDIYSLGVILYELLTGQLPFQGSVASIIGQVLSKQPDSPDKLRDDIDPRLAAICVRAMSKQIEDRFPSMKEFASALSEFLKPKSGTGSRSSDGVDTNAGLNLNAGPVEFSCSCGQRLSVGRNLAGKLVRCPRCGDSVAVPGGEASTLEQINASCFGCGQRFMARGELAGKVVKCPICGRPLTVPMPGQAQPVAQQIEVTCGCGQQFLAKAELAGRRVKCTSCGEPLTIPLGS